MDMNSEPGFRFNPFEYELIDLYLKPKVLGENISSSVIGERQLYGPNANPWEVFDPQNYPWIISEVSCGKFEKVAYAFVNLIKKASNSNNKRRKVGKEQFIKKAGCGTWDGQTTRTKIKDFEGNLIGERRMLVFEINEASDQEDLSWVGHWRMHEYHLCGVNGDIPNLYNTVLCKITLNHSKKPVIELHSNKIKAIDEKKNETKKSAEKLDVVQPRVECYDQAGVGSSPLEQVENVPVSWDDDIVDLDWMNSIFSSSEGESGELYLNLPELDFPNYLEPTNLGKRKFHDETSYACATAA